VRNIEAIHLKPIFRNIALALAAAAALNPAHAGVLTFQDVVFTTTWANNVLTLEIDAGQHSGNWAGATTIGALSLKDIGSFQSVKVTAAPKGVEAWKMTARELTANGCSGGGGKNRDQTSLCLAGTPVALTDNMVFTFAFTGAPSLAEPHLKVNFFDGSNNKVGDLLSQTIKSAPVVVTTPVTPPVTTPVVPPVTTPVIPLVTTPVTPPLTTPVVPQVSQPATPPVTEPVTPAQPVKPVEPVTLPPIDQTAGTTDTLQPIGQTAGTETPSTDNPVVSTPIPLPPVTVTQPILVVEPVPATIGASEVPEPRTFALLLAGLALMGLALRKRN
jgi:hypothetical protein